MRERRGLHFALLAKLMTCAPRDFDHIWDAGIAEWMESGAKVILEERTAKYIDVY